MQKKCLLLLIWAITIRGLQVEIVCNLSNNCSSGHQLKYIDPVTQKLEYHCLEENISLCKSRNKIIVNVEECYENSVQEACESGFCLRLIETDSCYDQNNQCPQTIEFMWECGRCKSIACKLDICFVEEGVQVCLENYSQFKQKTRCHYQTFHSVTTNCQDDIDCGCCQTLDWTNYNQFCSPNYFGDNQTLYSELRVKIQKQKSIQKDNTTSTIDNELEEEHNLSNWESFIKIYTVLLLIMIFIF